MFEAYPTTTEPFEDTSYDWLEPPPKVPIHFTPDVEVAVPPPLPPLAVSGELNMASPMASAMRNARQGKIFRVTVTSSLSGSGYDTYRKGVLLMGAGLQQACTRC